jgi:hypothetical protein
MPLEFKRSRAMKRSNAFTPRMRLREVRLSFLSVRGNHALCNAIRSAAFTALIRRRAAGE